MNATELLDVTEVERLALGPGDMVVIKVPVRLSDDEYAELSSQIRAVIPEPTKILVFEAGVDISVLRATP